MLESLSSNMKENTKRWEETISSKLNKIDIAIIKIRDIFRINPRYAFKGIIPP